MSFSGDLHTSHIHTYIYVLYAYPHVHTKVPAHMCHSIYNQKFTCFSQILCLDFQSTTYKCIFSTFYFLLTRLSLVCPIKNSKWSHKDLSKITYSINIAYSLVGWLPSIFDCSISSLKFGQLRLFEMYFRFYYCLYTQMSTLCMRIKVVCHFGLMYKISCAQCAFILILLKGMK